ncbi:BamA/TamA family outer membrane protein [Fulvivirga lutea]|uniref:BamA/TamA family outer membrane protein n=1 Tax=Fulvivirga lutea TaxID=2810512 RepID=A0A974WHM2_9BACT|nr:BamA/TamA family outer membrane protein [Fulvivirga lutea]QSE98536.1 BamA/TamA family outer membrane protein [Fulvivirga lutea]
MKAFSVIFCVFLGVFTFIQSTAQKQVSYTLYLVGDAGKVTDGQTSNFQVISEQINGQNEGLVFLGDNIYQQGMPTAQSESRIAAEEAINAQIELAKKFNGNAYFIPGNHDWAQGRKIGWDQVQRQEDYVEDRLDSANVFIPNDGCPGPVEVNLSDELLLVIIDTQWFLHGWDKPTNEIGGCDFNTPLDVLLALDQILALNTHRKVVVATHHPMYTYGEHGGVFPFKHFLMPPVVGAFYPFYRAVFGSVQDIPNPKYKGMRNALVETLEQYPNVIHVAGHEHSLQYSFNNSIHYIVSGSGSKTTYVKKKGFAEYAESVNGFAKLLFYSDGEVKVEYWRHDGSKAFSKSLMNKPYAPKLTGEEFAKKYDLEDSVYVTHASDQYEAGKGHKRLFGANYRDVWQQDLEVPVFDIGTEHGGLKIVQRGGGQQTKSLRLEAKDGKQYVLRSIEKFAAGAIPPFLRNTFAQDLVQDQISASHPYGAFVVPYLAEAAGIYHTNPQLVFIPDDPRFGKYQATFANTLALYEERPSKDWSDADFFGNSPDIESTSKVLENLQEDNDHYVDQKFVVKSRLFDMIIGDWDRHDDQWRWSEIDEGKGNRYRPIPRDRDQVFFVNEGFFPGIWKRKWALPKFEGFDEDIDWPSGLSFNARYFDRSFLTGLEREDWIEAAEQLKRDLTDEKIESAIKKWPKPIYDLHGERVIRRLKARRDNITESAISHYLFLAKEVDVVGSDKHENFVATRLPNGDVHVQVRKMKKDGDKKHTIFERTFKYDETKEIRLYALGGDDEIEIEGESPKGIKIRVIGGDGDDELDDDSKVGGFGKKNIFYDTKEGNKLKLNSESKNRLSNNEDVNNYNRKAFQYNVLMPLLTGNFNPDDGVYLGGGFVYTNHGFRKEPFKSKHKVLGSYAINTQAYNFNYLGQFTDVIRKWDLETNVSFLVPNFVNNFFGYGNESKFDQDIDETVDVNRAIDYYRLRFEEISYEVGFFRPIGSLARIGITHDFVSWELDQGANENRFVTDVFLPNTNLENEQTVNYMGGGLRLDVDTRKNIKNPVSGLLWTNKINTLYGIDDATDDFHQYNTELSVYHSFKIPAKLTFAARVGWGINFGDYPFFRGQTLGGREQIRGYRKTRFYGDEAFFSNVEARLKLFSVKGYILPATVGILGFHDVGRVWVDGENSDKWHRGIGGGIWIEPFNLTVLSFEVGASEEETLAYVRMGFLF